MACEQYDGLLQSHLDQSLSRNETQRLHRHLDSCSRCRMDLALYRRVFEGLSDLPNKNAPTSLTNDVMTAIDAVGPLCPRSLSPSWSKRATRWSLVAAAIAFLTIGVGSGVIGTRERPSGVPSPRLATDFDLSENYALDGHSPPSSAMRADDVRLVVDGPDMSILRRGTTNWSAPSRQDVELESGDSFRTGQATNAIVYYRDSGRIRIRPETEVQILSEGMRVRQGSTWVKIHKRGSSFVAETPNAVAAVRGTAFSVDVRDDGYGPSTTVCVFEGLVLVYPGTRETPGRDSALLPAGRRVNVTKTGMGIASAIPLEDYLRHAMVPPTDLIRRDDKVLPTKTDIPVVSPDPTDPETPHTEDLPGQRPEAEGVIDINDLRHR